MKIDNSIFDNVFAPAPRYLSRLALVQELVDALPGEAANFLEIGPGMGDVSHFLANRFPQSRGTLIEFSTEGVALLRRRFADNERVSVVERDIRELPGEQKFDLIVACEVLEHIENDTEVLELSGRIVRLRTSGAGCVRVDRHSIWANQTSEWHSG